MKEKLNCIYTQDGWQQPLVVYAACLSAKKVRVQLLKDIQRQVAAPARYISRIVFTIFPSLSLSASIHSRRTKRWKKNSFYFHSITHVVFCFVTTICWSERLFAHNTFVVVAVVVSAAFADSIEFSRLFYYIVITAYECPRWRHYRACALCAQLFAPGSLTGQKERIPYLS